MSKDASIARPRCVSPFLLDPQLALLTPVRRQLPVVHLILHRCCYVSHDIYTFVPSSVRYVGRSGRKVWSAPSLGTEQSSVSSRSVAGP